MLEHISNTHRRQVNQEGANNVDIQVMIGPEQGWDSHVLRVLSVKPNGNTPKHKHDAPHINYILEGEGTLFLNGKENVINAGSYAYVPPGEMHQFKNTSGTKELKFICIVPSDF